VDGKEVLAILHSSSSPDDDRAARLLELAATLFPDEMKPIHDVAVEMAETLRLRSSAAELEQQLATEEAQLLVAQAALAEKRAALERAKAAEL